MYQKSLHKPLKYVLSQASKSSPNRGGDVSWLRVALRTMPYPDITLVGLEVEWA